MRFRELPIVVRLTLPVITFIAILLQAIVFLNYPQKTSLTESAIMLFLFYFSWKRVISNNTKHKKINIVAIYLFSSFIILFWLFLFLVTKGSFVRN